MVTMPEGAHPGIHRGKGDNFVRVGFQLGLEVDDRCRADRVEETGLSTFGFSIRYRGRRSGHSRIGDVFRPSLYFFA